MNFFKKLFHKKNKVIPLEQKVVQDSKQIKPKLEKYEISEIKLQSTQIKKKENLLASIKPPLIRVLMVPNACYII